MSVLFLDPSSTAQPNVGLLQMTTAGTSGFPGTLVWPRRVGLEGVGSFGFNRQQSGKVEKEKGAQEVCGPVLPFPSPRVRLGLVVRARYLQDYNHRLVDSVCTQPLPLPRSPHLREVPVLAAYKRKGQALTPEC